METQPMAGKRPAEMLPGSPADVATPGRGRKRQSRAERSGEVRKSILEAAAKVVGERGYAEASISRIAELADIAQGSFYAHFESRQALFDVLLLSLGQEMLANINLAVSGARDFFEVEECGIRALFDYLDEQPGFSRILHEAEFVAPKAYEQHYSVLCARYVESLRRAMRTGAIKHFSDDELGALANMLIYARSGVVYTMRKKISQGQTFDREACIRTYMQLVRNGVN